jgi:hypothetical protein
LFLGFTANFNLSSILAEIRGGVGGRCNDQSL